MLFLLFAFCFVFPVMCMCTPSRHAPKHQPRALPPLPGQKMTLPCHRGVSTMTACTHIVSIIRPCPPQSFCARPVVGTQPTTPFDLPRDHWPQTASGMKLMYSLTVSPFSFFFFSFRFSFFWVSFLFSQPCAFAHPLDTHSNTILACPRLHLARS